ncbi:MAG: hypothetical protein WAR24_05170 [Candidatus Acidiferrales bacterium]
MVAGYRAAADSFVADKPRVWSEQQVTLRGFDLHPDGKRFAIILSSADTQVTKQNHLTIVFNFFEELRHATSSTEQ